ncbi:hypothetical protein ACWEFJ_28515 [Actinosynnema sp. NPDC004786]
MTTMLARSTARCAMCPHTVWPNCICPYKIQAAEETTMAKRKHDPADPSIANHPTVGTRAGIDDVAPEGETITPQHIADYRTNVDRAAESEGLPAPKWED